MSPQKCVTSPNYTRCTASRAFTSPPISMGLQHMVGKFPQLPHGLLDGQLSLEATIQAHPFLSTHNYEMGTKGQGGQPIHFMHGYMVRMYPFFSLRKMGGYVLVTRCWRRDTYASEAFTMYMSFIPPMTR